MLKAHLVSSLLIAAVTLSPALAGKGPGRGSADGMGKSRMWEKLDLTDEQKEKLEKLHASRLAGRKEHMENSRELRGKIREELQKDKPDAATLKKYSSQTAQMVENMTTKRIDHLMELKKILNKEQFETFLNHEWRGKDGRKGHRKGHPCGPKAGPNCPPKGPAQNDSPSAE